MIDRSTVHPRPRNNARDSVTITLVDLDGRELPNRIKTLLKIALRRFNFRCTAVDWPQAAAGEQHEQAARGGAAACHCQLCEPTLAETHQTPIGSPAGNGASK
jgi:hypothetical protein